MTTIAFLGLGAMGSRMAKNLIKAGHDVTVWNRSRGPIAELTAAGAKSAATPRDAAWASDVVISMLTDDDVARQVWLDAASGAVTGLKAGAIAIESSTVTPDWISELSTAVRARSADLLDAPVAGSRPQAETAQLIFMVGGEVATLESAMPVLKVMGGAVHHVGRTGKGAVLKLAVNTLFAAQLASVAELLGFLDKSGIGAQRGAELLGAFPVTSAAIAGAARMMAAKNTAPMFTIDLISKDLGYVIAAGDAAGVDLVSARTTRAVFNKAQAAGLGQQNITALAI